MPFSTEYSSVFELAEKIKAKKGLVISKSLSSGENYDISLYSFGEEEGITWQKLSSDILLYVLEGSVLLEVKKEGKTISEEAFKGSSLFVKEGDEFQISGKKDIPYKMLFISINTKIQEENSMFIKNFNHGEVLTLKDQVEFEKGTIVSKTLVNSPSLTMTLFAFDQGQEVKSHSAPGDAFVFCLEGSAQIELNGKKLSINEGESLIMSAGSPHAVKAEKPYKMLLTVVKA